MARLFSMPEIQRRLAALAIKRVPRLPLPRPRRKPAFLAICFTWLADH